MLSGHLYLINYSLVVGDSLGNRLIGLVSIVFSNGQGDWCSIPGRVIPKP